MRVLGPRSRIGLTTVGLLALISPQARAEAIAPAPAPKAPVRAKGPPAATVEEAPEPDARDPDRDRILRLQQALESVVHGPVLGRLRVGMRVMDVSTGRTFFRRRGTTPMDPASNQKVLATATALLRLGGTYRFRTELVAPDPDEAGVVHGDVVLRGSGDPSLLASDLERMAARIAARGIVRIEGSVLADNRRIGSEEPLPDERSPLRISRGAVIVRVHPGDSAGAPAVVSVRPVPEAFEVKNLAQTRATGRSRIGVRLSSVGGRMVVTVSGGMALHHPGRVVRRVPPNQRLYAAALLAGALREAGVDVTKPAGLFPPPTAIAAGAPPSCEPLAVHESAPLGVLIRRINKDSDNEYADRLLAVVGAELYGGAATNAKGLTALRQAMTELGLPPSSYVPANGSGLGHKNRVSADALSDLLRTLYLDPRIGPEMLQSLSVGGVDGTTRNRFRGSPAAERVRAKTGTLRGKSCLSGFVGDGHDVLAFSILVDGLRGRRLGTTAVRAAQVQAVNAMMHYARGAVGDVPVDQLTPGVDFETGEEILETEEEEPAATGEAGPKPGDPKAAGAPKPGEPKQAGAPKRGEPKQARPVP